MTAKIIKFPSPSKMCFTARGLGAIHHSKLPDGYDHIKVIGDILCAIGPDEWPVYFSTGDQEWKELPQSEVSIKVYQILMADRIDKMGFGFLTSSVEKVEGKKFYAMIIDENEGGDEE